MDTQSRIFHPIVNQPGRIRNSQGNEIPVTFSLYLYQDFGEDKPGGRPSEGLCRVSDNSGAIEALMKEGAPVFLSSGTLYATIHLTSRCTFMVVGPVFKK